MAASFDFEFDDRLVDVRPPGPSKRRFHFRDLLMGGVTVGWEFVSFQGVVIRKKVIGLDDPQSDFYKEKGKRVDKLREETGIVSAEVIVEFPNWLSHDFLPSVKTKMNRLWGGKWHGQAQRWFLMRMTRNDDTEINLSGGGSDAEFADWKWTAPDFQQWTDYKRPMYDEVLNTFR